MSKNELLLHLSRIAKVIACSILHIKYRNNYQQLEETRNIRDLLLTFSNNKESH